MARTELSNLMSLRNATLNVGYDLWKDIKNPFLSEVVLMGLGKVWLLDQEDELGLQINCVDGFWKTIEIFTPKVYEKYIRKIILTGLK